MSKSYKDYRPVKQTYKMSCWAACLEWWTRYMSPQKPVQGESGLIYDARAMGYSPNVDVYDQDSYAALEIEKIIKFLERPDVFGLTAKRISSFEMMPDFLKSKLNKAPMIIYYYEPEVGSGHSNVIINCKTYKSGRSRLRIMEPSTGTYPKRDISYYYNDGDTIIGWLA